MVWPTELVIDRGAIVANWRALCRGPTAAVVKADAYGLGAAEIVPALYEAGCRHFFTAHPGEALAIRTLVPGAMVAVLNGLWPGLEHTFSAHDLTPVLGSLAEIDRWRAHAVHLGRALPGIVHVDTGMNRLGLDPRQLAALAADHARLDGIALRYVMTHLVSAECPEDPVNDQQRARFAAACAALPPAPRSFANSSGLFLGPAFDSDLARPGAALYGVNPTPGRPNPQRPVVQLRARILQVRDVLPGESVGYNGQWVATRPSRIATVSVGYADGYLRSLSNRATAYFDGQAVPLVGRVSMDLSTFDVTDVPGASPGAWLDLLGPCGVDGLAAQAGTNGYEILTSLGSRYQRRYS
jgi:alanine racemase